MFKEDQLPHNNSGLHRWPLIIGEHAQLVLNEIYKRVWGSTDLPTPSWQLSKVNHIFCQDLTFTAMQKSWNYTFQIWLFRTMGSGLLGKHPFFTASSTVFFAARFQDHAPESQTLCCWSMDPTTSFGYFVCDITITSHFWGLRVSPFSWVKERVRFICCSMDCLLEVTVLMSSACANAPHVATVAPNLSCCIRCSRGFMTIRNKAGERTEPCRTPLLMTKEDEVLPSTLTLYFGWWYHALISLQHLLLIPAS